MKITKIVLSVLSFLVLTCARGQQTTGPESRLFIVGVPHKIDTQSQSNILTPCLSLLLQGSKPADRILYMDAQNLQVIADATIPDGKQFASNPRARAVRLQSPIAALKRYSISAIADRADSNEINRIRVPQFLEMVGSHFRGDPRKPTVLLLGRPFYEDERDSAFTFGTNGLCPSDGHILTNSCSVFGTAHKLGILNGVSAIHWAYLDDGLFRDDHARSVIRRFWAIYVDRLGSTLTSWVSASEIAFDRAVRDVRDPVTEEKLDEHDRAIEMRRTDFIRVYDQGPPAKPIPASTRSGDQTQAPTGVSVTNTPLDSALIQIPTPTNGEISVAAAWVVEGEGGEQGGERPDVDLYFFSPGSPTLCFRRTTVDTSFGTMRYLRDSQAPQTSLDEKDKKAAWEAIVLPAGTPLDKCECYVNLFRGASRAVTGVVEVADGTKSVKIPFRFPESSGNRGADAETRPKPYWEKIELSVFSSRN